MSPDTDRTAANLREALAFFLQDDHYIDRLEAQGLKDLIMKDGIVSDAEKRFLQEAIASSNFDARALKVLEDLLSRANEG